MRILGIESSCDETAISIVEDGHKILSNVVVSQIDIFAAYGGVIPEIAARSQSSTKLSKKPVFKLKTIQNPKLSTIGPKSTLSLSPIPQVSSDPFLSEPLPPAPLPFYIINHSMQFITSSLIFMPTG